MMISSRHTSQGRVAMRLRCGGIFNYHFIANLLQSLTRRRASADRTARRQFQATGQPVSRTQASDAVTSRLPRYEAKCVQCRCFQCGSVPLRSDIKGTELPLPIYWYHSKGNWSHYNFAAESFYIMKLFVLYCRNCPKTTNLGTLSPFWRR